MIVEIARAMGARMSLCGAVSAPADSGVFSRICSSMLFLALVTILFWNIQFAHAIGVGAVSANSYIGQRLSAEIPVFNVAQPDALQVQLLSSSVDHLGGPALTIGLDRSNSQLAIRISSDQAINEPYVSFQIQVVDQQHVLSKEFTLLLNLAPAGQVGSSPLSSPEVRATPLSVVDSNVTTNSPDLMGPYDYAEAGNIPARFGAVIDGQSLWRVARRINSAMGVSINQMMLGLYEANPGAFASESVDSLQAGSYLNIPSHSQVSRLSDYQAKQALDALTSGNSGTSPRVAASLQSNTDSGSVGAEAADAEVNSQDSPLEEGGVREISAQNDKFRLTGIDENPQSGGSPATDGDSTSQEIINSLAATVGNLTQELIQKDKKIEFLEGKIAALEKLALVEGRDTDSIAQTNDLNPSAAGLKLENESLAPEESQFSWTWWYLLLPVLLLLGFVFRERLAGIMQDLNFGRERDVEFDSVVVEDSIDALATSRSKDHLDEEYSILSAVTKAMEEEDEDNIDFISMHSTEETEVEVVEDPDGILVDETNLDFEHRFERLLQEKDFDFALELLEFARHNEIEDDRYHSERLRLLQVMGNEAEFYNYYYDIESSIPTFAPDVQARISQLVVKLAETKA